VTPAVGRPIWLFEAGIYGPDLDPLVTEVRRQGMSAEVVPHRALTKGPPPTAGGQPIPPGARVLGYGTFPFARQLQLRSGWVPGAWCDPDRLDCAAYYPPFGPHLLNQEFTILTGVEAIARRDELFERYAVDDRLFVRPTACDKTFVGRCLDPETFVGALGPVRIDPAAQVLVARPREVGREWRLLVCGNDVVTGTQYAVAGRKDARAGYPSEVRAFAEAVLGATSWRPDPAFFLDVCESDDRLWIVELSGFSCCWLYQCDVRAVVASVSEEVARL
jgi:hypothetical protein